MFWSSVNLTGNQTSNTYPNAQTLFWSSVNLTGNQTGWYWFVRTAGFWSGVNLTGNQTTPSRSGSTRCFGAVSI